MPAGRKENGWAWTDAVFPTDTWEFQPGTHLWRSQFYLPLSQQSAGAITATPTVFPAKILLIWHSFKASDSWIFKKISLLSGICFLWKTPEKPPLKPLFAIPVLSILPLKHWLNAIHHGSFPKKIRCFLQLSPIMSRIDRTTPPPFTLCLYTIFQRKVCQSTSLQVRREFLSPCSHIRDTGPPKGPTVECSAFSLFRERYGTSCHSGFIRWIEIFSPRPVKDYYYLPKEDRAIHRSIACYVDKAYRQKATAATCYIRQEGIFLPSFWHFTAPTFRKSLRWQAAVYPVWYRKIDIWPGISQVLYILSHQRSCFCVTPFFRMI